MDWKDPKQVSVVTQQEPHENQTFYPVICRRCRGVGCEECDWEGHYEMEL